MAEPAVPPVPAGLVGSGDTTTPGFDDLTDEQLRGVIRRATAELFAEMLAMFRSGDRDTRLSIIRIMLPPQVREATKPREDAAVSDDVLAVRAMFDEVLAAPEVDEPD